MQLRVMGSNIPSVGQRTRVAAVPAVVHTQYAVGSQLLRHLPWVTSAALQAGRPSESSRTQPFWATTAAIRAAKKMITGKHKFQIVKLTICTNLQFQVVTYVSFLNWLGWSLFRSGRSTCTEASCKTECSSPVRRHVLYSLNCTPKREETARKIAHFDKNFIIDNKQPGCSGVSFSHFYQ